MLSKESNVNDKNLSDADSGRLQLSGKSQNLPNEQPDEKVIKSKLSAGPSNPNHKTFLHNEELIHEELNKTIAERNISARVSEICKNAKLSIPTFYLHHRNANDALISYEEKIYNEFLEFVIANVKNSAQGTDKPQIFELLLIFVKKNYNYFKASFASNNLHLLYKILRTLSIYLIGENTNSKTGLFYVTNLLTIIIWWGKAENFAEASLRTRAQEMAASRIWRRA